MSELVVMPKTDWQDILDSTRAKAGTTERIKSGDLATIIDNIVAGVSVDCLSAITGGTFTPATDLSDYEITHNLGVIPNFFIISSEKIENETILYLIYQSGFLTSFCGNGGHVGNVCTVYRSNSASSHGYYDKLNATLVEAEEMVTSSAFLYAYTMFKENRIKPYLYSGSRPLKAGHTYNWICGVLDFV